MAYRRKRTYRPRRRRTFRSKRGGMRRRGVRRINTNRTLGYCIPNKMRVKLPYTLQDGYSAVATPVEYQFRGNSAFDPDEAIGGGQPLCFDQYMALYYRFKVLASSIEVRVIPSSNTATASVVETMVFPHVIATPLTASTAVDVIRQQPRVKSKIHGILNGSNGVTIKHYCSTKSIAPLYKGVDASGTSTANPTDQWYWHIIHDTPGAGAPSIYVYTKIVYYLEFSEPRVIAGS